MMARQHNTGRTRRSYGETVEQNHILCYEEVLKIQDVKMMDQTARSAGRLIAEDQSN